MEPSDCLVTYICIYSYVQYMYMLGVSGLFVQFINSSSILHSMLLFAQIDLMIERLNHVELTQYVFPCIILKIKKKRLKNV